MIAYFPALYDDELLYSLICRHWMHSGYSAYSYFAKNTFIYPSERLNIEFINAIYPEVANILTAKKDMEYLLQNHTMFPQYAHFLPVSQKTAAKNSIINFNNDYKNNIVMGASGRQRYLKYCPLCAYEDRKKYGECYWHRNHQLNDIWHCYKHNVILINSEVSLSAKNSPILHPAEYIIPKKSSVYYCDNDMEIQLTKYITDVFNTHMLYDTNMEIGIYLHTQLFNTNYVSIRGEQRNISLLFRDISDFYKSTYFKEYIVKSRIEKIFTSYRYNFLEICLLSFFLDICPRDLINRTTTKKDQIKNFDNTVISLHKEGLGCNKIAKKLGVSSRTVRDIVYPKEKKNSSPITYTCGPSKKDWQTIDQQTLPLVKEVIQQIQSSYRPQKVNVFSVTKILKLPDKTLYSLPLCINEINKHKENSQEYWTRELLWAYQDTLKNNEKLQWTSLRKRTNLRRCNALACISLLKKIDSDASKALLKIIQQ